MNVYDSERITELLYLAGYVRTEDPREADLIIVNSCSIRLKAEQKMMSALGRYVRLKRRRPGLRLVLAGCTARLKGEEIAAKVPELDLLLGPDRIKELGAWLKQGGSRLICTEPVEPSVYSFLQADPDASGGRARVSCEVTVMKGCDNRCAYCVVPEARGPQVDRRPDEVVREVERLSRAGAREVCLIGQNVNAYRQNEGGLEMLLEEVARVPGIVRIRFTTSHPRDLTEELVETMARLEPVCEHVHLPVQSGSDTLLRAMGRGYTRAGYLEKVRMIRRWMPHAAISSDFIVGFPGETEEDHNETLSLIRQVGFSFSYSFVFSSRPGTRAAGMENTDLRVPEPVKRRRLEELQGLQAEQTKARLGGFLGRKVEVLVEGPSRRGDGQLTGRTRTFEIVNFHAPPAVSGGPIEGELVDVDITAAGSHSLEGSPVAPFAEARAASRGTF